MDERATGVSFEDTSTYEHAWIEWLFADWVTIGMSIKENTPEIN
jgi:hypothetical protein